MRLSLSTNWNSFRHESGDSMLDEILSLGFDSVELGYSLTFRQAADVQKRIRAGDIRISSVHGFCPNPLPGAHAGPEPYSLCDAADFKRSRHAIKAVLDSARFAAEVGTTKLVLHAGRAPIYRRARRLQSLVEAGKRATPRYEKKLARFFVKRERVGQKPLDTLRASLEILLPQLESLGVVLCLENLPTGDGCPNEPEMLSLLHEFSSPSLAAWHDTGHAQIRHELGLVHHAGILRSMGKYIGGFHLHDVLPPCSDHQMPPGGLMNFELLKPFLERELPFVVEPSRQCTAEELRRALDFWHEIWHI